MRELERIEYESGSDNDLDDPDSCTADGTAGAIGPQLDDDLSAGLNDLFSKPQRRRKWR